MLNILKLIVYVTVVACIYQPKVQASPDIQDGFLNKREQAIIADHLNEICSDTFCAGDYNFKNIGVFCSNLCVIYVDVSPHSRDDFFSPEDFAKTPESLRYKNLSDFSYKLYKPRIFQDFDYGVNGEILRFENIKVTARCVLKKLPYRQRGITFNEKKQVLVEEAISCTDEIVNSMRDIYSYIQGQLI